MDLPTLLLSYGVELQARGSEYIALCIKHDDHDPSMSVYRNGDDVWRTKCFSCGYNQGIVGVYCTLNGLDPENKTHQAIAIKALEDPTFDGGQKFATIKNDAHAIQLKREPRKMLTPPASDSIPRMDYLKDRATGEPFGEPSEHWAFRNADGVPEVYEARYIFKGKKEPRVFSYGQRGVAKPKWECAHYEGQRPIYGRDRIADCVQVAVFEGCRKAEKAQKLLDAAGLGVVACTAWMGGAQSVLKSDWSPIHGKTVLLFPDHNAVGFEAMQKLGRELSRNACQLLWVEDADRPDGWDICDQEWAPDEFAEWAKAHKKEFVCNDESNKADCVSGDSADEHAQVLQPDGPQAKPPDVVAGDAQDGENIPPSNTDPIPVEAYIDDGIVWTTPVDFLSEIPVPQLRPEFLPVCISDWVFDTAPIVGCDPAILAMGAITAAAACIHDGITVQPESNNPGWTESCRIWTAIVGDPSSKKSPAISRTISRLKKIQIELSQNEAKLRDEYDAKMQAYELKRKDYIKSLTKDETLPAPPKPDLPDMPRLIIQDVTVDKLSDLLAASHSGRTLIDRDELSGWFGSMDAFKNGIGGSDRSAWLELFNGGPRYIDRVGRGSIFVPQWSACLLGGIQPDAFRRIVDKLPEDGLLQRFWIINAQTGSMGSGGSENKHFSERYKNLLSQLFATSPHHDAIKLTSEANDIRIDIVRRAFDLIKIKFINGSFCSHLGKYEGISARLMLTLHCIKCADGGIHPCSVGIDADTAAMARDLIYKFLMPHAANFYLNVADNVTSRHMKQAANFVLTAPGEVSNRYMLQNYTQWRTLPEWQQATIWQQLTDYGWIQPAPTARVSKHGIPTRYLVNPDLKTVFAEKAAQEAERRREVHAAIKAMREPD